MNNSMPPFILWVAGWLIMIVVLVLIAKTAWGYRITYYVLWLSTVFVIVTHYSSITTILQNANITQGQY